MSHVVHVEIIIKCLNALIVACERLGLKFNFNQKKFNWYGRWVQDYNQQDAAYRAGIKPEDYGKCEHAISIPDDPNAYEIGVVNHPEGEGFMLVYDFWGPEGKKIKDRVGGQQCEALIQQYQLAVSENETSDLLMQGWQHEDTILDPETQNILYILDDGR